jgi:hypothetical protein
MVRLDAHMVSPFKIRNKINCFAIGLLMLTPGTMPTWGQEERDKSLSQFLDQLKPADSVAKFDAIQHAQGGHREALSDQTLRVLRSTAEPFYVNPGPWGRLRCVYVYLEPTKAMAEQIELPTLKTYWTVPLEDEKKLPAIFEQAGLPKSMIATLASPSNRSYSDTTLTLFPSSSDIFAMTPEMRSVVYRYLATNGMNSFYSSPTLITTESIDEWFATSKLRPALVAVIKQLAYRRGECLAFSDYPELLKAATSEDELRLAVSTLYRTRTLLVDLELSTDDDIAPIVDYWTKGDFNRRENTEPLMRAIQATASIDDLGLAHLLPALPRKLMYTYPNQTQARRDGVPDCHWTSFNFFNYEPQNYLFDEAAMKRHIHERFMPATPPFELGDKILLSDPSNQKPIHSCVQIADDLVFTKNGKNILSPWLIVPLSDVLKTYSENGTPTITVLRRKPVN